MLDTQLISQLQTPCIVVDCEIVRKNIQNMQMQIANAHCALRPHIKTHKMPLFAKMQIAQGAQGITCAKVSEAEVMADAGLDDIFIAYPIVGDFRIRRVLQLAKRIKRLIVAVDSCEGARQLNAYARRAEMVLEVRLEVDTGAKRTGVVAENILKTAQCVQALSHLNLTGIYTFKGLLYQEKPTVNNEIAGQEEGALLEAARICLENHGIPITEVSGGSSPTALDVAKTGKVTEVRPGTYIFKDYMLVKENVAQINEIAARFYATVVSTPEAGYAVLDGGTKTFPTDVPICTEPYFYEGYAIVANDENLILTRMNEEHGILTAKNNCTNLKVGQVLELLPIHICTAINLQNYVYLKNGDALTLEKVSARGMLV